MATSNHERIGKALELLNEGLLPFVERELQAALGDNWQQQLRSSTDDKLFATSRQETIYPLGHSSNTLGNVERVEQRVRYETRSRRTHTGQRAS